MRLKLFVPINSLELLEAHLQILRKYYFLTQHRWRPHRIIRIFPPQLFRVWNFYPIEHQVPTEAGD